MATKHLEEVRHWTGIFRHSFQEVPTIPTKEIQALRLRLLREEIDELEKAWNENNLVEAADALADIQFVLDGAILAAGLFYHSDFMFSEVYDSNMTKLGEDGKPIFRPEDNKVLKGPNYRKPNLSFCKLAMPPDYRKQQDDQPRILGAYKHDTSTICVETITRSGSTRVYATGMVVQAQIRDIVN